MKVLIKRIYEQAGSSDGMRVLIDALWPRGFSKEKANVDFWDKTIAPSAELRKWYSHDPDKWDEFKQRYFSELDAMPDVVRAFRGRLNNAAALKEYIEDHIDLKASS